MTWIWFCWVKKREPQERIYLSFCEIENPSDGNKLDRLGWQVKGPLDLWGALSEGNIGKCVSYTVRWTATNSMHTKEINYSQMKFSITTVRLVINAI